MMKAVWIDRNTCVWMLVKNNSFLEFVSLYIYFKHFFSPDLLQTRCQNPLELVTCFSEDLHCHHMQSSIKMDAAQSHQDNGLHVYWHCSVWGGLVGGTEKICADDLFCFLPHLCRHLDPVSLQHMLPCRENYGSS